MLYILYLISLDGNLPEQVLVGFVCAESFSGTLSTNPYIFENIKCNYFAFKVNGENYPATAYQPDFETKSTKYYREYQALLDTIGV